MQVILYTDKIIANEGNKGRKISFFSWLVNLDCIFFCHFFSNINITKMFSEESSSKIYYWLHCTVLDANKELEAKLEIDRVPVQEISNRQTDEAHTDTKMHQKVFTTTIILVHKAKWCTADLEKDIRQLKTTWLNTSRTQDLETVSQPLFFSHPLQYQYYKQSYITWQGGWGKGGVFGTELIFKIFVEMQTKLGPFWTLWALFPKKKKYSTVIFIVFINKTYSITVIFKCDRTGPSWKQRGLREVLFDGEGAASGETKGSNFHLIINN